MSLISVSILHWCILIDTTVSVSVYFSVSLCVYVYCFYSQLIDYWWYSHTCRDNKTHAWLIQEIMESLEYQTGNRLSGVMSVSWHLHTTSGYCFVYIGNTLSNNKWLVSMTMLSNLSASHKLHSAITGERLAGSIVYTMYITITWHSWESMCVL